MDETAQQIADIRAFNRFYTSIIGLLDEQFADGPLSLGEARVLYEIDARGHTTARDLLAALRMDRGYLSRMLSKFVETGLTAISPTPGDRRSNTVALTQDGDIIVDRLNRRSDDAIADLVHRLSDAERQQLVKAMSLVQKLLGDPTAARGALVIRGHRIGELGFMVHRQAVLYHEQFGWNAEFEVLLARIYADYESAPSSPPKNLWVAEQDGMVAGSVFIIPAQGEPEGTAQLRVLYVEPACRGQGIGRRLVDEAIRFSRASGYRRIVLWTQDILLPARRIYQAAGFTLMREERHRSFGADLNGQYWALDL